MFVMYYICPCHPYFDNDAEALISFFQSEEEQKILREYFPKNHKLSVFSDPQEVDGVLKQIETTLNS